MQRFTIDRQVAPSSLGHRLDPFPRRSMYEIHSGTAGAGQADDAIESKLLGELGMDQIHVPSFGSALGGEFFVIELDQVVVLGVHDHNAVVFRDLLHRELDAPHVEPQSDALGMRRHHVRSKNLETWEPLFDYIADLVEYADRKRAHQADME